jgi:hypothetical protein
VIEHKKNGGEQEKAALAISQMYAGCNCQNFPSERQSRWPMAVMSVPEKGLKAAGWYCKCPQKDGTTIREKGAK